MTKMMMIKGNATAKLWSCRHGS